MFLIFFLITEDIFEFTLEPMPGGFLIAAFSPYGDPDIYANIDSSNQWLYAVKVRISNNNIHNHLLHYLIIIYRRNLVNSCL